MKHGHSLLTETDTQNKNVVSFLKLVIPCHSSAPSQISLPNSGRQVSLCIRQVGGRVRTGCTTSWKHGPMGACITLSTSYLTWWDILFLSCPLPYEEHCNADGKGIWRFPARLQWSNSHTEHSLSLGRAAESQDAWYSVEDFGRLKIQEGRHSVALFFWTEVEMPKGEGKADT